ncbi:hypothetical protein [Pelomonas sp. SE-A7]|uniref:hypothetical protein n=1 Tax=Pelomonas sp. SE-A7 TaxID=3054953 RepID=UPI00259C756D|nr:hypothetical protein [Pelomonas sp. SE-A7]MDM4767198.1 hypothetical protein [Pelomonas sp. SE-A7]
MLRIAGMLALASLIGVVVSTSAACAIGLSRGTDTWCGFVLVWPIGTIIAAPFAVVVGIPADALFRRVGLKHWIWYVSGGLVLSLPVWYELAQPFDSPRWNSAGFFDSLQYLGTGAVAGLAFWVLRRWKQNAP